MVCVLAAECIVGILSIGAFILPAVLLLAAAVRVAPGPADLADAGTGRSAGAAGPTPAAGA